MVSRTVPQEPGHEPTSLSAYSRELHIGERRAPCDDKRQEMGRQCCSQSGDSNWESYGVSQLFHGLSGAAHGYDIPM